MAGIWDVGGLGFLPMVLFLHCLGGLRIVGVSSTRTI